MRAALLAWWFVAQFSFSAATPVGPFKDEADCVKVKQWFDRSPAGASRHSASSWCWWDGK